MFEFYKNIIKSLLLVRSEELFHPESPGTKVTVNRSVFGRMFKPKHFATLGEVV